jgi:hypothetical protein
MNSDAAAQPSDSRGDLIFVLLALGFVSLWIIVNSRFDTGWITGVMLTSIVLGALMVYVLRTSNDLLGKFMLFGLAAGTTELLADRWLIIGTKTLFYERHEPLLIASPVYMPAAWAVVLVLIGYLGYRAAQRWGMGHATWMCGLMGGLVIPVYESCAKGAGWWYYEDLRRIIWNTPYYIILGEFLLALALPVLLSRCDRRAFYWSLPIGVLMGLWIWLSYKLAFGLLG